MTLQLTNKSGQNSDYHCDYKSLFKLDEHEKRLTMCHNNALFERVVGPKHATSTA